MDKLPSGRWVDVSGVVCYTEKVTSSDKTM